MVNRRKLIQAGAVAVGGSLILPWSPLMKKAYGVPLHSSVGFLSDPALQPKFVEQAPNALDPGFTYSAHPETGVIHASVGQTSQQTGLLRRNGRRANTTVWGYGGSDGVSWPGPTIYAQKDVPTKVRWSNDLSKGGSNGKPLPHLLPVDESLHWAYGLHDYNQYSIKKDGVPIITHLHGGHSDYLFDGNPEFFYSPDREIAGPQWMGKPAKDFVYSNDQVAGTLWYHDHALGITRLNVYAGLAGFYILRDSQDTGKEDNPLGLPAGPYELGYAIQDRMFTEDGQLFYPAYEGDPLWDDFITDEGATPPIPGGPSALAEFFGDHMVVNGKLWPKTDVEPRNYRVRLINGTDSRFLVIRLRAVSAGETDLTNAGTPISFQVIGSDQGLAGSAMQTDTLVFEPGARYDLVIDFSDPALAGKRVIIENIGGDAPFGGAFGDDLEPEDFFDDRQTDRIMAFDVSKPLSSVPDNFHPSNIHSYKGNNDVVTNTRKVALFEGLDEYGRLQPLLGAEVNGEFKALPWHAPTTENPGLDTTEDWEIYNFTGDAHPVHLHLVNFQVLGRKELSFENGPTPQVIVQHNGALGQAPSIASTSVGSDVNLGPVDGYAEDAPKDMVTALPDQVTRIRATFDKPGRYVWHCHILSHEDHEMMRVLHVGPGA
jgi:spore coat protein A